MGKTLFEPVKEQNVFEIDFKISNRNTYRAMPSKINDETCSNFGSVNKPGEPKIYVLIEKKRIIYIGGTRDNLRARLYSGLNNPKHHYKWRSIKRPLKLVVFVLPKKYASQKSGWGTSKGIEAVESELAYIVRLSGGWPEYQTEIHFHSKKLIARRNARAIAEYLKDNELAKYINLRRYT